jgi:hypothetical protein
MTRAGEEGSLPSHLRPDAPAGILRSKLLVRLQLGTTTPAQPPYGIAFAPRTVPASLRKQPS